MNICLNFFGLGIKDIMQAHIKIINNKKVLFEGDTYNGSVCVCIRPCCVYKLIACSLNETIIINFYVDCKREKYYFYFPRSIYKRIIAFHLMDLNYPSLLIEKGEIILWQK